MTKETLSDYIGYLPRTKAKVIHVEKVKAFIDKVHRLITIAHAEQWTEVKLQNEISKEAGKELTEEKEQ